jgi:hypothetical protein
MESKTTPRPASVTTLVLLLFLLGLGAALSGAALVPAPDGHLIQMPISNLENAPFSNFLIPGTLLLLFIGIYPIVVAYALWKRPSWDWARALNPFKAIHWSWAGALAAAVALVTWILVQVQWVPIGFLHILYLAWAAAILLVGLLPGVRRYFELSPRGV